MTLPKFRYGGSYAHPLIGLINWRDLSGDATKAIFTNAKKYFGSLVASHDEFSVGVIAECALALLTRRLSLSERSSVGILPMKRSVSSRVVRDCGFPCRTSYRVEEDDLVEFALQHSGLAEIFSADERFAMLSDFITRNRESQCWGSFKRSVKLKEWKNGVGDEFNLALASIREKADAICSTRIEDCSSILPFFAGLAEWDAFKARYEKSVQTKLYAMIDALVADVAVIEGGVDGQSKSGIMRDNRYHHEAKIKIGDLVKYEFSITVTDIGAGAALGTAVKIAAKFIRGWLLLIAVPVFIVFAVVLLCFHPTGMFGDIIIYTLAIAGAYILFHFLTGIP